MDATIARYKNAHKFLFIPIFIILIGFWQSYFTTFLTEPWGHHLHAISAIFWFVLLILQPYLVTRGHKREHRLCGMIGIFIAGAVVFSALSITPSNIYYAQQGGFPPYFPADFFYGIIFTETLAIFGFAAAVIMALIRSRSWEEHGIWMISTVFFGMMPAWGRMAMIPVFALGLEKDISDAMYIAVPVFLSILLIVAKRLNKLTHPAIIFAALINLSMLFIGPIGRNQFFQRIITDIMKPIIDW